jgi:hypothetical protein
MIISRDIYVSASIANGGLWEMDILSKMRLFAFSFIIDFFLCSRTLDSDANIVQFLETLRNYPGALAIDLGSNIGQYALYAAK